MHGEIARAIAHNARATGAERMSIVNQINAVPARDDGNVELIGDAHENLVRSGNSDAVARIEYRTFRIFDPLENRRSQTGIIFRLFDRLKFFARRKSLQLLGIDRRGLNVDRHVEPHRSGASVRREIQHFLEATPDLERIGEHFGELCHCPRGFGYVEFLIAELPKIESGTAHGRIETHLPRDHKHRNGIEPRAEHSRQCVRTAGTGRHAHARRTVCHARESFRRDCRRLLVMMIRTFERGMMPQRVIQKHRAAARHREHVSDPMLN